MASTATAETTATDERSSRREPPEGVTLSRGRIWLIFVGLILSILLAALDQTIVSTALPTIAGELNGFDQISWAVTAYLLGQVITMPLYGKLGDLLGRKPVFLFSILVFLLGSVLAGIAQSMDAFIAFRVIQGVGAGGLMVGAQSIIGEITSPRERGKYMSVMMPMIGIATVVGPLLGGFLTEQLSWRWVFYINIPLGAIAVTVVTLVLKLPQTNRKPRIDYLGAILLGGAVTCLVLLTTWGGTNYAWDSPVIIGLLVGTVALATGWVLAERRAAEPVMPLRLFTDRVFVVCACLGLTVGLGMFAAVTYIPTFLQIVGGAGAANSGLLMLPMVAGMMGASVLTGQLLSRFGRYKIFPIYGTVLAGTGMYLLSTMGVGTTRLESSLYMVVLGAGIGSIMPVLTTAVQNSVQQHDLGSATSAVNFFRQMGASVGTALVGTLFNSRLDEQLRQSLPPQLADRAAGSAGSITPETLEQMPPPLRDGIVEAFADALPPVFVYFVPVLAVGFVLALLQREKPLGKTRNAETGQSVASGGESPAPSSESAPSQGGSPAVGPGAGGRVRDPDGRCVDGATVTVIDSAGRQAAHVRTDADGGYRLALPRAGSYLLVVSTRTWHPYAATITVDEQHIQHDVTLEGTGTTDPRAAGTIRGTVRAASDGSPLLETRLTLLDEAGRSRAMTSPDTHGNYTFTGLVPGEYTVMATPHAPHSATVWLEAGQHTDHDFELDHAHVHQRISLDHIDTHRRSSQSTS